MSDSLFRKFHPKSAFTILQIAWSVVVISLLTLGPVGAGKALAACSVAAAGDTKSIVWRAGVNASWSAPEAASGGVSIITGNDIAVDATTAYAKIKFTADASTRRDTGSFEYLKFAVRASNSAGVNQKISAYVVGDESGDTFNTRCVVTLTQQWKTVQIRLSGLGVSPGATFEQLRFRNDSGDDIQFKLNNISFGGVATEAPEPDAPGPDLRPRPAQPISRCTAPATGDVISSAWSNGSSSQWQQPQALGGGVTLSTSSIIEVNSSTTYGKMKIQAQSALTGVQWIQFDVRSIDTPSADPGVEAYIYSTELGDTYAQRCRASAGSQWRRYRIALSAFGGNDNSPVNQIRFRNGSNAPMTFAINNIVFGGEASTDPEDPVDPDDPDNPTIPPQSRLPGQDRLVNWSTSVGADPVADRNLTLMTMSPPPAGTDASIEINRKLKSANRVLLRLSPGNYTIKNTIKISGRDKILRGSETGKTTLIFDGVSGSAIQIGSGFSPAGNVRVLQGIKGTRKLVLDTTPAIAARFNNQVIEVDKLRSTIAMDEPARGIFYTREGDRWPGQLNRVVSVAGNVLNLASPLVLDYRAGSFSPEARMIPQGAYNIGVENLVLRGTNIGGLSSAIFAKSVTNIWVKNVVSRRMPRKSHIELVAVYRCSIQRNVFDDAQIHGNGGQGYGVNLQRHTTGCLVEDNIFHRLRHSMIINLGAAGNALLYNYATEPVHPNFEKGGPADISFHGNYTSGNLVEGNVIERITMTDDCCKASPSNTIVRNCLLSSPLTLNFGSDSQNIVGNAIYGSDSQLRRTLIDGGSTGRSGGKPALTSDQGPLFSTTEGKDGLYVYPDKPSTRYNERSLDLVQYGNYHNGRFWYDQVSAPAPRNVPKSYYYVNTLAQRRSIFPTPPAAILSSPTGNEATDCDIPARRRAPAFIQ